MKKSFKGQPVRHRHAPQRTCVACRETKAKRELIRIVCTAEGEVEVDLSGKKSGRGAYLCPKQGCWELGLKKNRLGYALRTNMSLESHQRLLEYSAKLPKGYRVES